MKTVPLIFVGLLALAAFLLALPGAVLAGAEMLYGRNLTWGPALLVAHAGAALCALFWAIPLFTRRTVGHWGWFVGYVFAFVFGLAALDKMHFNFLT